MLARILTSGLAVALLLPALLRADNAPKGDTDLDGSWEVVSIVRDGKETPLPDAGMVLTIKGESVTMKIGVESQAGAIKIDAAKTPKVLDLTPADGPRKGKTMKGIYEIKGDELKICQSDPDVERPTELASKEGSGLTLATLKRVKK